ncbi:uncharacterized protein LOC133333022 isoform X1 [Musca vetustissima]|uniref:uncharacterized protein LOC133326425 n=1 Tax=Musca vetustissima TaxID=27455 RepID=UPI002AB74223|nr:uncharacterized protein LOC133326425 [Musca vetustissima]XP_061397341.1 uncharacterized protein LOC133333022 isoform X1 [Musca vetustissima]
MLDFEAKRNALFACLDDASSELKGTSLDQTNAMKNPLKRSSSGDTELVYRNSSKSPHKNVSSVDRALKNLRGKESIFKKPELPISRCLKPRSLPDFKVNPHKWKKYSLEDVDISDHTNTSAAFEFLREIDARKETDDDGVSEDRETILTKKIEFKKSSKINRNIKTLQSQEQQDVEVDSPKLKGSKLVMPEYVIGGSKKKVAKAKNTKQDRAAGKLKLSHLQEEDEDDE